MKIKKYQFWFCTGSQDLYGDECLRHVAEHSKIMVERLNASDKMCIRDSFTLIPSIKALCLFPPTA